MPPEHAPNELDATNDDTGNTPADPTRTAQPPVFYRINPRPIPYGELRLSTTRATAMFAWFVIKVLRIRVPCSTDDPSVESLAPFEVPEEAVREEVRASWAGALKDLESLGFHSPVYHAIDDALQTTETFLVSLSHPTRPVVARIHARLWRRANSASRSLFTEFITACDDGTFLWTVASRPDLRTPASCTVTRQVGEPPLELWKVHEGAVSQRGQSKALPARTREEVLDICERHHGAVTRFHVERGVFVPHSAVDEAAALATREAADAAAAAGSKHPQVLQELIRLQTKKASWRTSLIILGVTLAVFLAVGLPGQRSFLGLLALVPILLFHEFGHYVAMRAYGYRNLRMFFIPGFGAAVSGRAFNVPGWKRAVVALMGPVPGIVLGIIVGLCGIVAKSTLAIDAALLLVILNGFNLLPVLPLDGGRVLHAVLFSRHHLLDAVFRVLAALSLLGLAIAFEAHLFIAVGVFLLLSIPLATRLARTAAELKREGFPEASPNDQLVPLAAAERIIDRLSADAKGPVAPKVMAQQTLDVFETLNTRPTGWISGIGLMVVYALCVAVAVAFTGLFVVARQGKLQDFVRAAATAPPHSLIPEAVKSTPAPSGGGEYSTVVVTFAPGAGAAAAYDAASKKLGPGESATLVGDTVLIRFPTADDEARKRWMADLGKGAQDAFVAGTTLHASFRVQWVAPDQGTAEAMETELEDFFASPVEQGLIPPWSVGGVTAEHRLARATFRKLWMPSVYNDPAMQDLRQKIAEARKQGEGAEAKRLVERQATLMTELRLASNRRIADDESGGVDRPLAQEYLKLSESLDEDAFFKTAGATLAPRLGQLPANERAVCARAGWVHRTGLIVQLTYVQFEDPSAGAVALVGWLRSKGCASIRYEVHGESTYEEEEEGE